MNQLNGYCLLASWHPCNDGRWSQLAFNRQMSEERALISVVYSVSVAIKALMASIACRAKHQWNLTHSTFSNKVERETERDRERIDYWWRSRVLWQAQIIQEGSCLEKSGGLLPVFDSVWNEEMHPQWLPFCTNKRLQSKIRSKHNVRKLRAADGQYFNFPHGVQWLVVVRLGC